MQVPVESFLYIRTLRGQRRGVRYILLSAAELRVAADTLRCASRAAEHNR
jgi:hypothetical protein